MTNKSFNDLSGDNLTLEALFKGSDSQSLIRQQESGGSNYIVYS